MQSTTQPKTPPKILRLKQVLERVGLGKSTVYSLISKKQFPSGVKLTSSATGWYESSIDEWILSRNTNQ